MINNEMVWELLNRDALYSTAASEVGKSMYTLVSNAQQFPREVQIIGAAAQLLVYSRVYGADPVEILRIADRIFEQNPDQENWRAAHRYVESEIVNTWRR